jgi:hypothetical protein
MSFLRRRVNSDEEYNKLIDVAIDIKKGKAHKYSLIIIYGGPATGKSAIKYMFTVFLEDILKTQLKILYNESIYQMSRRVLIPVLPNYGETTWFLRSDEDLLIWHEEINKAARIPNPLICEAHGPIKELKEYKKAKRMPVFIKMVKMDNYDPEIDGNIELGVDEVENTIKIWETVKNTALYSILCFRQLLSKDVAKLIGKYVFDTKRDGAWFKTQ